MCEDFTTTTRIPRECDDPVLAMYRTSHEAVARYSVVLWPGVSAPTQVIEQGLSYDKAIEISDRLNAGRENKRFSGPLYGIRLENPEEALEAVRKTSRAFWTKDK